jgi:SAM-dependent methyltransferase
MVESRSSQVFKWLLGRSPHAAERRSVGRTRSLRQIDKISMIENHFGEAVASRYDATVGDRSTPEVLGPTVDLLAELAGDGAALEFAVGTGRVALPLADRGVPVSGIELSEDMISRLRAKDGGDRIDVTLGDITDARIAGRFNLVFLVYNTIGNVFTQERQVACFANAAAHLEPGGHFVIEVGVPNLRRLPPGENACVFAHTKGYVGYDRYTDFVAQQAVSHHFIVGDEGSREIQTPFRFVYPSELDLMAKLARMSLIDRWADWDKSPFTGDSRSHVSVWQKAAS